MNTHEFEAGRSRPAGAALSAHRQIRLREVDGAQARLAHRLGVGLQAELPLGEGATLRFEAGGLRPAGSSASRRPLLLQTQHGTLALSPAREVVRALAGVELPEDDGADPLQALRLDMALQSMPAATLPLFAASTFLVAPAQDAPGPAEVEVSLTLHRPHARLGLAATLRGTPQALLHALSGPAWRGLAGDELDNGEDLPLAVPVCVGIAELSMHSLDALAPGDVVPIAHPFFDLEGEGELAIAKGIARCRLHLGNRTQVEITEWHPKTAGPSMHDDPDFDAGASGTPHDASQDEPLDDVRIALRFELGSLELSLSDLRNLAPGSVLDIAGATPPLVAICAGRRRVGLGELVELGGRLAVEVRRIGASS